MKTVPLEIDRLVFKKTEDIQLTNRKLHNGYFSGAFTHIQKRPLLEEILQKESKAVRASSFEVLKEFESIDDEL